MSMETYLSSSQVLHKTFQTIGLVGKPRSDSSLKMHKNVFNWLHEHGYNVIVEFEIGKKLNLASKYIATLSEIGEQAQLVIVIGGDGNMLGKARELAKYHIPLIGINRGNLGFLTDIDPHQTYAQLEACLERGEFFVEERFLLEVQVKGKNGVYDSACAVNEVVVHPAKIAHMLDFHVYINDKFAFSQRSDGLIIATPTGSTAYSLSAGGPIMTPDLNALALVPMFPHTLSSRPLVIDGDSKVSIRFADHYRTELEVGCDSQIILDIYPSDIVHIQKSPHKLRLLHLNNYNYYNVLSAKLGWFKNNN